MALVLETIEGKPADILTTPNGKFTNRIETGELVISADRLLGPKAVNESIIASFYMRGDLEHNEYYAQRVEITVLPANVIATMAYNGNKPLRGELLKPDDPMMFYAQHDKESATLIARNNI